MPMADYQFSVNPETLQGTVVAPTAEKVARDVTRLIASDYDGKVRKALVDLGWTPPPTAPNPVAPMFGGFVGGHGKQLAMSLLPFEEPRD